MVKRAVKDGTAEQNFQQNVKRKKVDLVHS